MAGRKIKGEIKVASRIVDYLSSGLYESSAACLKELVNNSFDADATRVDMFVKPDADRIIIEDDGSGMTSDEFVEHFSRLSQSRKREVSDTTPMGRAKIGKIGIGFIAANEICEVMEIYSTKKGSDELLHVFVNFQRMREPIEERRREGGDVAKGDYEGTVEAAPKSAHYTKIFLTEVREGAQPILASLLTRNRTPGRSLYGLSADSVADRLRDPELKYWSQFDEYSENLLHMGLNVPVRYHDKWMPKIRGASIGAFTKRTADLDFEVYCDGSDLRKPVVFRTGDPDSIVERFGHEGHECSASGYVFGQNFALKPENLVGILLRIREAAVGQYDPTFLGFPTQESPLMQRWVSGEIWVDDRLEEAMNIDRRTLRVSHPAYRELQVALHEFLSGFFKRIRKELHGSNSLRRNRERAGNERRRIVETIEAYRGQLGPSATSAIKQAWSGSSGGRTSSLTQRLTVSQLYDLVLDVAEQTLEPEDLRRFTKELTERLSD